ncbi:hypothetical protein JCM1841_001371 [Sporobolomyces salmonicolor]
MSSPSPISDVAAVAAELPPLPERTGFRAFWARPAVQVAMVSFTVFCSLSGVGGGGQVDPRAANDGNVALYSTFAVVGFASGAIINKIGARLALCLGACGYALYMGSLLSYNINSNRGFVVGAGAILGICAGLLWTAQGSLTLAYATEATKGRLFALFWIIFNMGGVLGSAIELGLTYDSTTSTVSNAVYIVFMTIGAVGAFLPIFLVNPGTMVRTDGTRVIVPAHPTVKDQFVGLFNLLRTDYIIFLLFPYFLASNWMYTYQQNSFNGARFTLRTRSLNSLLYWGCQCVAAGCFGIAIDMTRFRRTTRAWGGFAFLLCLAMGVWGWAYHYQKSYDRADIDTTISRIDFRDSAYPGRALLYIFFGIFDAIFQNYIYWLLGAMTNLPSQLAYLVGLYKGIQSVGAAGAYRADSNLEPYMSELAVAWALSIAGLLFAAPVVALRIGDHTEERVDGTERGDAESTASAEDKKMHHLEPV